MSFNIDEEQMELIRVINDDAFNYLHFANKNSKGCFNPRINFLWLVLILTIKYPQVELYLKKLLNYFAIDELERKHVGYSIVHHMFNDPFNISLNSFEMIINVGININIKNNFGSNATCLLGQNQCNDHVFNILNLLIKYGINLNIFDVFGNTTLDILTQYQAKLNKETKKCIITIIDFGGITNDPANNAIYDFIEYYKCSTIKAAIKK